MSRLRGPGKWIVLTDLAGLLKILFWFGIYSDLPNFLFFQEQFGWSKKANSVLD